MLSGSAAGSVNVSSQQGEKVEHLHTCDTSCLMGCIYPLGLAKETRFIFYKEAQKQSAAK